MPKITISQVMKALPKIESGLQKYLCLRDRILTENVAKNDDFQRDYNHFFRVRQKSQEFYTEYYKFMEKHKNDKALTYEAVLKHLYRIEGKVEASFASKLLSMINPDLPVLDRQVLENLDVKLSRPTDHKKRIECSLAAYEEICEWYKNHFKSGEAKEWIKLFDGHYPEAKNKITDVKKIDLILWQIRD